jgi:hypothetical protein
MSKSQEIAIPSKANTERFTELVEIIDRNSQGFREVGDALLEIYENEFWRVTHKSFAALCSERWGFNKTYSYDLVESSRVMNRLVNNFSAIAEKPHATLSTTVLPTSESQARELAKVDDHEQAEVWAKVLEETDTPTAKIVKSVVKKWNKLKEAVAPKPKKPAEKVASEPKDDTVSECGESIGAVGTASVIEAGHKA